MCCHVCVFQGLDLTCSNPPANPSCCTCLEDYQSQSLLCEEQCPSYYYLSDSNDTADCLQLTTPTTVTAQTTSDNNATIGNSTTADGGTQG